MPPSHPLLPIPWSRFQLPITLPQSSSAWLLLKDKSHTKNITTIPWGHRKGNYFLISHQTPVMAEIPPLSPHCPQAHSWLLGTMSWARSRRSIWLTCAVRLSNYRFPRSSFVHLQFIHLLKRQSHHAPSVLCIMSLCPLDPNCPLWKEVTSHRHTQGWAAMTHVLRAGQPHKF